MSYCDLDERSLRSFFLLLYLGRYSKLARESCVKSADKFRKEAYLRCDTNRTGWVCDSKVLQKDVRIPYDQVTAELRVSY